MALVQKILACFIGIIIIAVMAGCIAVDTSRNTTVNISSEVLTEGDSSVVRGTPHQTELTTPSPDRFWITIDAIPDHTRKDPIRITGKTNLGVTEPVLIEVYPLWWSDVTKRSQCGGAEIAGASFTATFFPVKRDRIFNEWNITTYPATFPNQEYIVIVSPFNQDLTNSTTFAIFGTDVSQQTKGGC